jgi:parallel beta-helix repeat protein
VNSDYSIRVQNSKGSLVYSAPQATERYGNIINLADINFIQAGAGAVTRTALSKMRESVTVQDFGASSSASASVNLAAFNNALASGAKVVEVINDGGIMLVDGTINVPSGVTLIGVGLPTVKAANNAFPSGGAVIALTSATSSNVDGLKIDANRQNNGASMYGINCVTCVKTNVTNNYVINTEYGIYFLGGNTLRIIGNTVDDCIFYGITVKLNDVLADCYNIVITDNECKNISTGGTGPLVDGQGIIVYGATGLLIANYKNITEVIVNDNICSNCGRQGITLVAVNDFVVDGNKCYDNLANTDLASGILISEACYNGTVTGNTCTNNYDAGILLDIVDQTATGNRFDYGHITVTGNSCSRNVRAGIKINSCPFTTISGNHVSSSIWGIFLAKGGFNNIIGNNISYCSENGIRLAGLPGAVAPDQSQITVADNILSYCVTAGGAQLTALFATYISVLKVQNNICQNNTGDLNIRADCDNVTLLDNRFTSTIYTGSSVAIQRWEDEFRTTASGANWLSNDFGGSGIASIRVDAGFTVPHFGLRWIPLLSVAPVTSSLTTAIHPGIVGQELTLINYNTQAITLKQAAGIDNIGNADVVLAYGEMVKYTYTGSLWLQTTAKIATSL